MSHTADQPSSSETLVLGNVLFRLSGILEDLHLSTVKLQDRIGTFGSVNALKPDDITTLQSLDIVTQTQADLAMVLAEMAQNVPEVPVNEDLLRGALKLGRVRDALVNPATDTSCAVSQDVTFL